MKNLRTSLVLIFICLSIPINAQIKVLCNGNVGIGTTSPRGQFDVAGTGDIYLVNSPIIGTYQSVYLPGHIYIAPWNGTNISYIQARRSNDNGSTELQLRTWNNDVLVEAVRINSAGNVGIATTSPSYLLDVNGNLNYSGTLTNNSDERCKENIIPLSNCLENIIKLNGKQYLKVIKTKIYTINKDTTQGSNNTSEVGENIVKQEEYGVIAQEIEKIFPKLVKADNDGMLSINYIGLIPVLVESVKELNTKATVVQQLKTTSDSLITIIKSLENSNQQLAQRMSLVESELNICCNTNNLKLKSANIINNVTTTEVQESSLSQNMPNPFTQKTEIQYYINESSQKAMIHIYDMQGTPKKSYQVTTSGNGSLIINGFELRAGMYLYTLIVDGREIDTKRMILTD